MTSGTECPVRSSDAADRLPALLVPALLIGTFMGFLDLFVVTVALPSIRSDLHAGAASAQLVLSGYVVAYGVSLVAGGRLGDRFGRRRLFLTGMAGFTGTSLLCALAPDAQLLVAARVLQGLSAAAMLPQVLATFQAVLPERRRGPAIGAYGAVVGVASVCGQVVGGLLVQADLLGLGWRMLFLINLPVGVAGLTLAARVLPASRAQDEPPSVDLPGLGALTLALVALLGGLTEGPDRHWPLWAVSAVLAGILAMAGVGYVEWMIERRGQAALVPPRLVARRPMRVGLVLVLAFYASNTGFFVVLTYFLQDGLHVTPLVAGLTFAPIGVGFSAASMLSRSRPRLRSPLAMAAGSLVMLVGLGAAIAVVLCGGGPVPLAAGMLLSGIGQGIVAPPLIGTVLAQVEPRDAGAASGVLLTATQIANALGIAILGGVWEAAFSHGASTAFTAGTFGAVLLAALAGAAALALARPVRRREPDPRPTGSPVHPARAIGPLAGG